MRRYLYKNLYHTLLQPDIVGLVTGIHEYKGAQTFYLREKADALTQLAETAQMQSMEAFSKFEEIYVSDQRLKKIVCNKTMPKNCNERMAAGSV